MSPFRRNARLLRQLRTPAGRVKRLPIYGTPLAINICGNGFQNHCEKLETADRETKQYGNSDTG
jgi:hypothetical protein